MELLRLFFQFVGLSQRVKKNLVGAATRVISTSQCQSMSSSFDLPEDIVVKILCRLPVKSLIRFTCVSKRWLSIISDPKFGNSHFQLASKLRTISRKVLLISYPTVREPGARWPFYYPTTKLPPRFQTLDDKLSVKTFTFPFHERRVDMIILGSCNGLVLLGQYCCENLCVWNLSTGFFRKISDPCFPSQRVFSADGTMLCFTNHGFGYVSASDDYKLVFIVPALGDLSLEVHIFSLRANFWRVITVPYSSWPGWDSEQGTFSNGAIHWVIGNQDETSDPVIYAFDLAKEEFCKVTLPSVLRQNEEGHKPTEITTVLHSGGYLCICSRELLSPMKREVWAMTVYGVPESWIKLFQFDIHDFPDVFTAPDITWDLCFITESSTMVIKLRKELFWIECRNEEKPICSGQHRVEEVHPGVPGCSFYFDAIAYDETLVSVAE